jgi:hypothetical protein
MSPLRIVWVLIDSLGAVEVIKLELLRTDKSSSIQMFYVLALCISCGFFDQLTGFSSIYYRIFTFVVLCRSSVYHECFLQPSKPLSVLSLFAGSFLLLSHSGSRDQ